MIRKILKFQVFLGLVLFVFMQTTCFAQSEKTPENSIKAAYIYNFAKFVGWPDESFDNTDDPIYLCILGEDPALGAIKAIENKTIRGRQILIKQKRELDSVGRCHILFVGESESKNLPEILLNLQGIPCLTVSSMQGFARSGGMINFILVKNKIRFEVNLGATKRSKLILSSRLLKLAVIVDGQPAEEVEK